MDSSEKSPCIPVSPEKKIAVEDISIVVGLMG
jgi:hypothetical protein